MIGSIVIGVLIFAYAAWMLVSFIRKSRQGRCATCAIKDSCNTGCSVVSQVERQEILNSLNKTK